MNDEWIYFKPNVNEMVTIIKFDDGNENYKYYTNKWYIVGEWRGKIALVNVQDLNMKIDSISKWKTIALEPIH